MSDDNPTPAAAKALLAEWRVDYALRASGADMTSDEKRLSEVMQHIDRIKAGNYPAIVGRDDNYRVVERPWAEMAEPAKLAVMTDAVDWSGISNRDQAHILLGQVDPGKITDAQRNRLIDMATVPTDYQKAREEKARAGAGSGKGRNQGHER
jgi:hypothetical protein